MAHGLVNLALLLVWVLVSIVTAAMAAMCAWTAYLYITCWSAAYELRLRRRQFVLPNSPEPAIRLARLYSGRAARSNGPLVQQFLGSSFEWYELAYKLTTEDSQKQRLLHHLARTACEIGADTEARVYASALLKSIPRQPSYAKGSAIHYGHAVLGRLALRAGDIGSAARHLIKSVHNVSGPGLESGGPYMKLAQELLDCGQSAVVLRYLAECGIFWQHDFGKLNQWRKETTRGVAPDFGKNLRR